jgi:hypothetical protein
MAGNSNYVSASLFLLLSSSSKGKVMVGRQEFAEAYLSLFFFLCHSIFRTAFGSFEYK